MSTATITVHIKEGRVENTASYTWDEVHTLEHFVQFANRVLQIQARREYGSFHESDIESSVSRITDRISSAVKA